MVFSQLDDGQRMDGKTTLFPLPLTKTEELPIYVYVAEVSSVWDGVSSPHRLSYLGGFFMWVTSGT